MPSRRGTYDRRRQQLAKIHIEKKDLISDGLLTEDGYRAMIASVQHRLGIAQRKDQPSAADLNARGRSELLNDFRKLRGDHVAPAPQPSSRYVGNGERGDDGYHLTQDQADYIAHLEDVMGWTEESHRMVGFIERQTGKKKAVSMLTNSEASKVITGLERLAGISTHPRKRNRSNA